MYYNICYKVLRTFLVTLSFHVSCITILSIPFTDAIYYEIAAGE